MEDVQGHATAIEASADGTLFAAMYPQLCRLARAHLRRSRRVGGLDTTTVVHESYLRFARARQVTFQDQVHFMGYLSRAMRAVILDSARRQVAARRGSGVPHLSLADDEQALAADPGDVGPVRDALRELEALDQRVAWVVQLRYFAGMTDGEIAATLDVNERTVRRDWEKARLWLGELLRDG